MAAVVVRILLFSLPTVVVPAVLTAAMLGGISRRPNTIQKTFAAWFGDADDPITGLRVFFLWWLLIQIVALPLLYPVPRPVPLSGKFTCIGAGDIPRVMYLVCMYGIVPFLFIRLMGSVMRRIPIRNTALGEIVGFTLGYLIVVILVKLITPVEILIALALTGVILADKKARRSMLGDESPRGAAFLFTCVFVMALLFMIIVNESSEFYRRTIHDGSKRIFGHSGQGTVIDMIWNFVFFYVIPLLIALQYRHHASIRHPKKSDDHEHAADGQPQGSREATGEESMLLGLITGVLLGIFVQLALPEKLRPTTLLYRSEDRLFSGIRMPAFSLPNLRMPRGILPSTRFSMPLPLPQLSSTLKENLGSITKNFTGVGGRTAAAAASSLLSTDKSTMRRSVQSVARQALGDETTRRTIFQNVSRLTGARPQTVKAVREMLENDTARKALLQSTVRLTGADSHAIVDAVRQAIGRDTARGRIFQNVSNTSGTRPQTVEAVRRSVLPISTRR